MLSKMGGNRVVAIRISEKEEKSRGEKLGRSISGKRFHHFKRESAHQGAKGVDRAVYQKMSEKKQCGSSEDKSQKESLRGRRRR